MSHTSKVLDQITLVRLLMYEVHAMTTECVCRGGGERKREEGERRESSGEQRERREG